MDFFVGALHKGSSQDVCPVPSRKYLRLLNECGSVRPSVRLSVYSVLLRDVKRGNHSCSHFVSDRGSDPTIRRLVKKQPNISRERERESLTIRL